jgi:1-acyl-sn-glycerol-3-phosphate acyltransferase
MASLPSRPDQEAVAPSSSRWRAAWRLVRVLGHLLAGLATLFFRFPRLSREQKEMQVQIWADRMLACLGITLQVRGAPPAPGPLLLVANHISWLDITALHAARYCRFVSKADVRRWPLIGTLAAGAGTLFIERASRRDASRMVQHMAQSLRDGDVLAVFPEGTTSDGLQLLPFHANLLQAAITAGTGQRSLAPCYIGDDTLVGSVWRTLCAPGIVVQVCLGEAQQAEGRDRRAWAADLRTAVGQLADLPLRD